MAPHIMCQTTRIPATRSGVVEEGFLVFADDTLMAVVIRLDRTLDEELEDLRGRWYLETGYGACTIGPGVDQLFRSPDEAQRWVLERVSRAREAAAHAAMMRPVP